MFSANGINDLYIKIKGLDNPQNKEVSPNKQVCLGKPGIIRHAALFL